MPAKRAAWLVDSTPALQSVNAAARRNSWPTSGLRPFNLTNTSSGISRVRCAIAHLLSLSLSEPQTLRGAHGAKLGRLLRLSRQPGLIGDDVDLDAVQPGSFTDQRMFSVRRQRIGRFLPSATPPALGPRRQGHSS